MDEKKGGSFRNPTMLTVSEIDRNFDSESEDCFSSGDSWKQLSDSECEVEFEDRETDLDITQATTSSSTPARSATLNNSDPSPHSSQPQVTLPLPLAANNQPLPKPIPPTNNQPNRRKQPRPILPWSDTPDLKTFIFSQTTGLRVTPGNQPIDYFNMLVDDCFLESIVRETNINAENIFLSANTVLHSRICQWKNLTLSEFKTFLGLLFHTGIVKMPELQMYWRTDKLFKTCFGDYMSRDRFLLILRCLHLAKDDDNSPDRVYKIRPAIDYFNNKMNNIYLPGKELSLDESMVLWRGRLVFKQYIKNKRHKYGIKLYILTEPNGIILKFCVYAGAMDALSGPGHTEKVVLHMLSERLEKGHSVYADNFYNSYSLSKALLEKKTYITGTLRADRLDLPAAVIGKKLQKGETTAQYCNGVMVGKWKDVRVVTYLSTQFENDMNVAVNKRGQEKLKPLPIIEYNDYMSGVDRQDQMMSYYPSERKCLRWYKKLCIHILQMALLNAYLLYNKYNIGAKMTMLDFRLTIIRELLTPAQRNEPAVIQEIQTDHLPTKAPIGESGRIKRRRCVNCSRRGQRKDTIYQCGACPETPPLCLGDCFKSYHDL